MAVKSIFKRIYLILIILSLTFPLIMASKNVKLIEINYNSAMLIEKPIEDGRNQLITSSYSPFQNIIDDMEDISDWIEIGTLEISNSTDCTEGNYSMNITYPCNSTFGVMQIGLKNLTSLNINFSKYDTIEFDAKFINIAPFSLTILLKQPPSYDTGIWYRNELSNNWTHIVVDIRYFQIRPLVDESITFDALAFLFSGNTTAGTNVNVLIDDLKVCGTGIRLSSNETYSDISEGVTHTFNINVSRLLGTGSANYIVELNRTALVEFQASLSNDSITLPENGSTIIYVNLTAPIYASIDSTESVILWVRCATDLNQNHSIRLIAGVKRNIDKIYFISDIHSELNDIYCINPDGTNLTRITDNNLFYEEGPMSLSSNGTYLSVARNHTPFDLSDPSSQNRDIWVLNLTNWQMVQLTDNFDNELHIDFSPNETYMSYNSNHSNNVNWTVCTINLNGSNFKEWTNTSISCWDVAWSHNKTGSDLLAFGLAYNVTNHQEFEMYVMNLTDQSMTRLTDNNYTETDPYFSADDTNLIYDRYVGEGLWYLPYNQFLGPWGIYEYNLINNTETQIYNASGIAAIPCYSPDNTEICFSQYEWNLGLNRLVIINRDGSNSHHLKYLEQEFTMKWQDWGPRRNREYFPDADIVTGSIEKDVLDPNNFQLKINIKNVGEKNITSINVTFHLGFPNGTQNLLGQAQVTGSILVGQTIMVKSAKFSTSLLVNNTFYALLLGANPREFVTSNNIFNITSIETTGVIFPIFGQGTNIYGIIVIGAAIGTVTAIIIVAKRKKSRRHD